MLKPYNVTFSLKRRKGMAVETTTLHVSAESERDARRQIKLKFNRCNHMPEWRNYRFRIDSVVLDTHSCTCRACQ